MKLRWSNLCALCNILWLLIVLEDERVAPLASFPVPSLGVAPTKLPFFSFRAHNTCSQSSDGARMSRLQLFKHQPLSTLAKWQARQRGFPRLSPPVAPEVPDVFLQFLLVKRGR